MAAVGSDEDGSNKSSSNSSYTDSSSSGLSNEVNLRRASIAAQDFVKSIIGGMQIVADKPFEIGDFIEVGEFAGTVTEITYRSTRIKATNNSIIAVPNSVIVTEYVKNWSRLEHRRLDMELRIDLNTPKETI